MTSKEVTDLFKTHPPVPDDAVCEDIARRVTAMNPDEGDFEADAGLAPFPSWNFAAAADAARTLSVAMPSLVQHWDGLFPTPETRAGFEAVRSLQAALAAAMPYVEWPLGHYQPANAKKPRDWHILSVLIASIVQKALASAGHPSTGTTHNTVTVTIVQDLLKRIGMPVEKGAIAQHLTRWHRRYGGYKSEPQDL